MTDTSGLIAGLDAVLLDFDGPVCSIFSGYRAHSIAAELLGFLEGEGVMLSVDVASEPDPLAVLRWTSFHQPELTTAVENRLCKAELAAIKTAAPASFAVEAIADLYRRGHSLAVVSNNSAPAILEYLKRYRLKSYFDVVIGRPHSAPERMKPEPEGLIRAIEHLGVKPEAAALVGDSISDMEAAQAAGVHAIGYAEKEGRRADLVRAGAEVVINSMSALIAAD